MADVPLKVIITADGKAIRKALRGIQKEVLGNETKARKEIEKTDKLRERSLQKNKSQIQQLGREFKRLGGNVQRELQKSIFTGTKRGIQKAGAYMKANRGSILKGLGAVGAAGVFAGRQAIGTARGITGAPTIQENIANAKEFEHRMTLLQNQSRMTEGEMGALQAQLLETSRSSTLSPLNLLAGVEAVQRLEGADALEDFLSSIGTATKFSEGLGANFEGLAKLTTVLSRQFHISQGEMDEMVGFMAEAGVQGSVELENFSAQFPRVMGVFTNLLGQRGVEGARTFTAAAQGIATGFPDSPEEASTAMKALISTLVNPRTIKILKTRGLDPQRDTLPEIAKRLQERPLSPEQMGKAFNRMALGAMVALIGQYDPSNPKGNVVEDVLAARGSTQVGYATDNVRRIREDFSSQDLIRSNDMAANMIGNFQDAAASALRLTEAFDKLTSTFPKEILMAQTITAFLSSLSVMAIAMKMLCGGTAAKAVASGTGGMITRGTAAVGGAGAIGAVAAGVALPAAVALGAGAYLASVTTKEDEDMMERFARKLGFDPDNKLDTEIGRELNDAAKNLNVSSRNLRATTEAPATGKAN